MPPAQSPTSADTLPHPTLEQYYSNESDKPSFVRGLFDDAAGDYDRLERLMSLGTGSWYRRQALLRAGLKPGMRVLDVAVGTGLLARQAVSIVGDTGRVIGVDPSPGMLAEAARSLPINLIQARAEELPFAPASFDFLSMGYAFRHVANLPATIQQFVSVLRPGGTLLILEITSPRVGFRRRLMGGYIGRAVPILSRLFSRGKTTAPSKRLWEYYWETMNRCIDPPTLLAALSAGGLTQVRRSVELGIFSEYSGIKAA